MCTCKLYCSDDDNNNLVFTSVRQPVMRGIEGKSCVSRTLILSHIMYAEHLPRCHLYYAYYHEDAELEFERNAFTKRNSFITYILQK